MTVVTRFAPSPTGYLHIGNLRTALFNYLIARKSGGEFILRIDDTDPERSKQIYIDALKYDLEWLGLHWDRVEHQSARLERYEAAAERLRAAGRLYEAFETRVELDLKRRQQLNMGQPPVYDRAALALDDEKRAELRRTRHGHWRFLLEHGQISWTDGILGEKLIDATSVSDPVLLREDGQFLYTLASVVDDIEMGITHVVRGADHVTNTATQIQIMTALGGRAPAFSHHSLLTGAQGEALSKRLGTLALRDMRESGVVPMALLSHMACLGASGAARLFADIDEIAAHFEISHFGTAPTKFTADDLFQLTARILASTAFEEVAAEVAALGIPAEVGPVFWETVRENITTLKDLEGWWKICRDGGVPEIAPEDLEFVQEALALLPPLPFDNETWGQWTSVVKEKTGRKGRALFQPLRKALTGCASGPDMGKFFPLLKVIPTVKP